MTKPSFFLFILCLIHHITTSGQCSPQEMKNLRKSALIFGEKNYKIQELPNPAHDAQDMADSLKKVEFDVETYLDADLKTMDSAVDSWFRRLGDYDIALFYFSGHARQSGEANFLYPVDADPTSTNDLYTKTFVVNKVVERLSDKNLKCGIILLDACRTYPKAWEKGSTLNGLTPMSGEGIFIGFAAQPGKTAIDDASERNAFYTGAILKYITQPNQTIDGIFTKINNDVRLKSNGQQIPFKTSSLNTEFCFNVSFKDTILNKKEAFNQFSNSLAFSPWNDQLLVAFDSSSRILVKNLHSTTVDNIFVDEIKPFKIVRGQTSIYILDTFHRKIFSIDTEKKIIIRKFEYESIPTQFLLSHDEKKIFTVELLENDYYITSTNIKNLIKDTLVKWEKARQITSILSSNRTEDIFFTSFDKDSSTISKLNLKSKKITTTTKFDGQIKILGITSSGETLFLRHQKMNVPVNLLLVDPKSLTPTDTVKIEANSIEVCRDSAYLIICTSNAVNIMRLSGKVITNTIQCSSEPIATATSREYITYAYLPKEKRIKVINMLGNLQPIHYPTPEEIYENFKKRLDKDHDYSGEKHIDTILNLGLSSITEALNKLNDDLGARFTQDGGYDTNKNFDKKEFSYTHGLRNRTNGKTLFPTFKAQIKGQKLVMIISLENMEDEKREFSFTSNDLKQYTNDAISSFVTQYLQKNINKLY